MAQDEPRRVRSTQEPALTVALAERPIPENPGDPDEREAVVTAVREARTTARGS